MLVVRIAVKLLDIGTAMNTPVPIASFDGAVCGSALGIVLTPDALLFRSICRTTAARQMRDLPTLQ